MGGLPRDASRALRADELNLDLPWNPARLEQRMARVHRIGSRRTIQELRLVTKESIEERILKLHETKRNALDNIWSKDGEDTIAAPGGSGAFQQMLKALLDKQSFMAEPTAAHPTETEATPTDEAAGSGPRRAGYSGPAAGSPITTRTRCVLPSSRIGIAPASTAAPSNSARAIPRHRCWGFSTEIS